MILATSTRRSVLLCCLDCCEKCQPIGTGFKGGFVTADQMYEIRVHMSMICIA